MSYKPHQEKAAQEAHYVLRNHGMVAIFGMPRTGKTRASFRLAELNDAKNVLFLTKKAAIAGIKSEYKETRPNFDITVTNYEQVKNLDDPTVFDLVVIDESHNLGARGRPTNRVKDIRAICYNLPAVFLTGTPTIETPLGIYHQWCVTKYSPFRKYKNFYAFFREYGIPSPIWVNGRSVEQYKKAKDTLSPVIEQYAVRISQDDAGIEHQAQDRVHVVPLEADTKEFIEALMQTGVADDYMFDTDIGVRTAVHQAEYGALLYEDELIMRLNTEVVDYLLETFGDTPDVAYFTHFRSTREKLSQHFKRAKLFSSIAHAEGVDMSHMKHMVIVNTGYSGAKFTQLRERVTNMNRTSEALVHHIVTDGGISREVYDMVSQKKDFNLQLFRKHRGAA